MRASAAVAIAVIALGATTTARAEDDMRWARQARALVADCAESDKVMSHDDAGDRLLPGGVMAQKWRGACDGGEAVVIVCMGVITKPGEIPRCFLR